MQLNPLCVRCKAKGIVRMWEELDHIVSLDKGGEDILENTQGLCKPCHAEKTAEDMGYRKRTEIGLDGWPVENDSC